MKKAKIVYIAAIILFLFTSPASAIYIDFKDGQVHDIDYRINGRVRVDYETPGMRTTVNLLKGSQMDNVKAFEDSLVNMSDGSIEDDIVAYGRSRVNISGGIIAKYLWLYDSCHVELTGGRIGIYLNAYDSSQVKISDGLIKRNLGCNDTSYVEMSGGGVGDVLISRDSSRAKISGGLIGRLIARDSSQMEISGASVREYLWIWESTRVELSGGSFGTDLIADELSVLTVKGQDFAVDGVRFGYGQLESLTGAWALDETPRHLTGTLGSGQTIDNDFYIGNDAKIVLIPGDLIHADMKIEPHTINLKSKGKWITARFRFPIEFNVADIERDSVLLNGTIRSEPVQVNEDRQLAIAAFDRQQVQAILSIGQVELTITGHFIDGTFFTAADTVKVIDKTGGK